jgi:tetratricopeptide (TPR) repeat protein
MIFEDGIRAFLGRRFQLARGCFLKCVRHDNRFVTALFMLGLSQLMDGQYRSAAFSFESLLSSQTYSPICQSLAHLKLGLSHKCGGRVLDAERSFGDGHAEIIERGIFSLLLGPRPFEIELGLLSLTRGKPDLATEWFRRARDSHEFGAATALRLAQRNISADRGEPTPSSDPNFDFLISIGEIGNILRFYDDPTVLFHEALCLSLLGQHHDAEQVRSQLKDLAPDYKPMNFNSDLIERIRNRK